MDEDNDSGTDTGESETDTVDSSVLEAKIGELTAALAAAQADLVTAQAETTAAKAANWDLLQQIPSDDATDDVESDTAESSDDPLDDVFA